MFDREQEFECKKTVNVVVVSYAWQTSQIVVGDDVFVVVPSVKRKGFGTPAINPDLDLE